MVWFINTLHRIRENVWRNWKNQFASGEIGFFDRETNHPMRCDIFVWLTDEGKQARRNSLTKTYDSTSIELIDEQQSICRNEEQRYRLNNGGIFSRAYRLRRRSIRSESRQKKIGSTTESHCYWHDTIICLTFFTYICVSLLWRLRDAKKRERERKIDISRSDDETPR